VFPGMGVVVSVLAGGGDYRRQDRMRALLAGLGPLVRRYRGDAHVFSESLVYFRSPHPDRSWATAAGAVLDTAALAVSTVDAVRQPAAELRIRSGYVALRRIGDFFGMPYDPAPSRMPRSLSTGRHWSGHDLPRHDPRDSSKQKAGIMTTALIVRT
jgi:hypothetical protein